MKISGIYKIVNRINGHLYIGSTVHFKKRRTDHLWHLANGSHHSGYLQNAWNKYGSEQFEIILLEEVHESLLIEFEQKYIDRLLPCYNMRRTAEARGIHIFTQEIRDKISKSNTGRRNTNEMKIAMARVKNGNEIIERYTMDGTLVDTWYTSIDASRGTGIHKSSIGNNLTGRSSHAGKFIFKYKSLEHVPI